MGIIEVQTNKTSRLWLKVIAFFVAFVFLFQQLGIADIYSYKRAGGVAEEVLPTSDEYDKQGRMGPQNLQRSQQRHEELIRQRMGKEDMVGQLLRRPKEEEEDMPLKKKKSGAGGGGQVNYTMTEPDDVNDPHNFNDLIHDETTSALQQIDTFDITRYPPIDLDYWKEKAEKKQDEKTGLDYWVGYEDEKSPEDNRKIKEAVYFGGKEEEKIEKVYSGYVLNPNTNLYEPKFRTDYEYEGDAIKKMIKYYIWGKDEGDTSVRVEESFFEGGKDDNKIVWRANYSKDDLENPSSVQYFFYGEGTESDIAQPLRQTRSYDTKNVNWDANGDGTVTDEEKQDLAVLEAEGRLLSITYMVGEKDKEIADYTVNLDKDGATTSTVINYYKDGERAETADNRDPKERVVTYRGDVDTDSPLNADGILTGYEDQLSSIAYYHTEHRLPGEEVLDYTETFARGTVAQTTVYYYGEDEVRASEANYRLPMKKSVAYWGGDVLDADGNVRADAREKSATYYFIEARLKGEETVDYTIKRNSNERIVSTMFYYYEGDNRASESDAMDRMSKTVTYRGEVDPETAGVVVQDAEGNAIVVLTGYQDKLASITYNHYEGREKGKEISDYTAKYNTQLQVVSTTINLYEAELKRAEEATSSDRMSRTVTYRRWVDPEAPDIVDKEGNPGKDGLLDGYEDQLDSITYFDFDSRNKGEEVSDYTEKYNSSQEVASTTAQAYDLFNEFLDTVKEKVRTIGASRISIDIEKDVPEALRAPLEELLKVEGVELTLSGNLPVDVAVAMRTGKMPSALYEVEEALFTFDVGIRIKKSTDDKLVLEVQNGVRDDFRKGTLRLTPDIMKKLKTEPLATLPKVLAEWARYSEAGCILHSDSEKAITAALYDLVTVTEARANIDTLKDSIDELVGADRIALRKIMAFIHPEKVELGLRIERGKIGRMEMMELAEHFARPVVREVPVAPAVPSMVAPPVMKPAVLVAPEEELTSAVSAEHMSLMVQWMRSRARYKDLKSLSDRDRAAMSAQELQIYLAEILKEAGSSDKPVISGFDFRKGHLDDDKVIEQIIAEVQTFKGDVVRHVIVVDKASEADLRGALGDDAAKVQIVAYDERIHTNIIEAFNVGIGEIETDRSITIDRSLVALALTESDAPAVREYYRTGKKEGRTNVFNYLVVNPGDEAVNIKGQGDMLPTLNLASILTRLAVKTKPTVMTVACSEATIMDLERALEGMLNFIRIKAQNIGKQVREFIDSVIETDLAL
ncbi:MAG: hypothetical protein WBD04_05435 [Candidatus Omnitrophota bacterium]